jgi:hypothetical protein
VILLEPWIREAQNIACVNLFQGCSKGEFPLKKGWVYLVACWAKGWLFYLRVEGVTLFCPFMKYILNNHCFPKISQLFAQDIQWITKINWQL